jgi:DNA-binding MarR family transcriptional regulator
MTNETQPWKEQFKTELKELNLTYSDYVLLQSVFTLSKNNTQVTQVDVCNATNSKPMNASIRLRKLQTLKLIQRKEHPVDTRAKTVHITAKGTTMIEKIIATEEDIKAAYVKSVKQKV